MTDLGAYLSSRNISQRAFAARLGVHQSIVSRLCRREIRPGLDLAFHIQRETHGAVPAESWVECAAPSPDRAEDAA
jgi:transcriptional regulator with XRE-family HTH domain